MKKISAALLILLTQAILLSSCAKRFVDWQNHTSFRSTGRNLSLTHIEPTEPILGRIDKFVHYVSIAVETVFFKELVGTIDSEVALGFEIKGVLPNGEVIKTVPKVVKASGEDAFLSFDNMVMIEPFLYTGQNITMTIWFKAVEKERTGNVKGRLASAGDVLSSLNPFMSHALKVTEKLFQSIIGASSQAKKVWKYSFTPHPVSGLIHDKPEMLFTAARHILMAIPPADAPARYQQIKPQFLFTKLKLRGNRLVYKDTEEEYRETPYIILNITRYKRYPKPDTEIRKLTKKIDRYIENGNLKMARDAMANLAVAINEDQVITQNEKNLERTWREIRMARIDMLDAKKSGKKDARIKAMIAQLKLLVTIKKQFRTILEPHELQDISYRLNRLKEASEELSKEMNRVLPEAVLLALTRISDLEKRMAKLEKERLDRMIALVKAQRRPEIVTPPTIVDPRNITRVGTPIYKKWWFWTLIGAALAGGGVAIWYFTQPGPPGVF